MKYVIKQNQDEDVVELYLEQVSNEIYLKAKSPIVGTFHLLGITAYGEFFTCEGVHGDFGFEVDENGELEIYYDGEC